MQIHCPSCAAAYNLPVILLTTARTMRCAVCAHDWQTIAVDPETAQAALLEEARPAAVAQPQPAIAAALSSAVDVAEPSGAPPSTEIDTAFAAGSDSAAEVPAELPPDPLARLAPRDESPARPRARLAVLWGGPVPALLGWAGSFAMLFVCGRIAIEHRAGLMAAWPPSKRVFLWLGLG